MTTGIHQSMESWVDKLASQPTNRAFIRALQNPPRAIVSPSLFRESDQAKRIQALFKWLNIGEINAILSWMLKKMTHRCYLRMDEDEAQEFLCPLKCIFHVIENSLCEKDLRFVIDQKKYRELTNCFSFLIEDNRVLE